MTVESEDGGNGVGPKSSGAARDSARRVSFSGAAGGGGGGLVGDANDDNDGFDFASFYRGIKSSGT